MKLLAGLKILGLLLMVAIVIGFVGCGEDEDEPVSSVTLPKDSVIPNTLDDTTETSEPAARIVWIKINEVTGAHEELSIDFEACDQIKNQDVLIVRVLDANGNPVSDALVEWILNTWPDGVGDIIETDDPGHKDVPAAPQIKVDNKFAKTFTNSADSVPPQLRGMGKDGKDIEIRKGETWITITSTREGDTDVTAFAPAIPRDGDDPHKIFGVKHWLDLDWTFPNDQPDYDGENSINYCEGGVNEHTFVTTLRKVSNPNASVPGVVVRYSILPSGPDAIWKDDGSVTIISEKVAEATSDEIGGAKATIKLRTLERGENQILVEILPVALKRHGDIHEPDPDKVAGECNFRGEATKKWTGPELTIIKEGAASICLLTNESYTIKVENVGDGTATDITVTDTFITDCLQFVSADNGGTPGNGVITWNIGNLEAGKSKTVGVTLQGINTGSCENTVEAVSVECVPAGPFVLPITIGRPELSITKTGPPIVGLLDEAIYEITVKNTSDCKATDVTITDTINTSAFEFVAASDGGTYTGGVVTWENIVDLEPGRSKTVDVTLRAIKDSRPEPPWENTAGVTCGEWEFLGLPPVTFKFETEVVAPELQVVCEFTSESIIRNGFARLGEMVTKSITITNESGVAASLNGRNIPEARGIAVTDTYPMDLLEFVSASDGGVGGGDRVIWDNLGTLGPNELKTIIVEFIAKIPVENPCDHETKQDKVSVDSNEGQINSIGSAEGECEITVSGVNELELERRDIGLIAVGEVATYAIRVVNQSENCSIKGVRLEYKVPELDDDKRKIEMEIQRAETVKTPLGPTDPTVDRKNYTLDIDEMLPKEEIIVELDVKRIDGGFDPVSVTNIATLYVKIPSKYEIGIDITRTRK